jgi:hypothetical protein
MTAAACRALPSREKRVRTLGWDGLDVAPAELIHAIGQALSQLNHTYDVDGEESAIVLPGLAHRGPPPNDLIVQFLVQQSEGGLLNLDIRRLRGDAFRFHALYRDFRKALAAINGWDELTGEYRKRQLREWTPAPVRFSPPPPSCWEEPVALAIDSGLILRHASEAARMDRLSNRPAF